MAVGVCGVVFALAVIGVAAAGDRLGVGHSLREAVVAASALLGGFVTAITELLGAAGQLRFTPVLTAWLAAAAILGIGYRASGFTYAILDPRSPKHEPWSGFQRGLFAAIFAIVAASGTVAVLCPPNNYDVCLYHLPRQLQWLQQGSVAHFPTQDYRLTVNPPFAEFVGLHLMLLSGTDRLATVESWGAMLLALTAVSLVGRELGLSRTGQLLAILFAVTVPVGFYEAANGKNDWWVAFWLASTTYWVLRVGRAERVRILEAVCAGLSLGLLLFTKGTGGVFAIPLSIVGALTLSLRRPAGWLPALAVVSAMTLAPSLGHWSRNVAAYGSISGPTFGLENECVSPEAWASGLVRNVGMHLATPKEKWNRKVDKYVRRVHGWLGVGVADPHTTWLGIPFAVEYRPQQEDVATAPVHTVLLLTAIAALVSLAFRERSWLVYLFALTGGFALFCLVFKWQPWHPRLHLPCFALGGVAFGWMMTQTKGRFLVLPTAILLVLSLLPAATRSSARSLGGEGPNVFRSTSDQLRFYGREELLRDARRVVERIRAMNPDAVDLINQEPAPWEYPIAWWLREGEAPPHVGYFYPVAGSPKGPTAEVVLDVGSDHPPEWIRHPRVENVYRIEERLGRFSIYRIVRDYAGPPVPVQPAARFGIGIERQD